jgi:hypothetical protein
MRFNLRRSCALVLGLLISSVPVLAHHGSGVSYDMKKQTTMTGTVTKLQWANPHTYIMYTVKDDDGKVVLWGAESHPPNQMADRGWNSTTLKPGDVIVITVFPSKIGTTRGLLSKVVMNGKVLLDDTGRGAQE